MGNILVVDLNSGSYSDKLGGHELFNLVQNPLDGNYYGYVPPNCTVSIEEWGASKGDAFIDNVLVVYVQAISTTNKKNKLNREIVAYCENARIYRKPQSGVGLNREFINKANQRIIADWCIKSDNLKDLRGVSPKFLIETTKHNSYIFRGQRSKLKGYPSLQKDIEDYVNGLSKVDRDLGRDQENIQNAGAATAVFAADYGKKDDEVVPGGNGKTIKKNASISKKVLQDSRYICACDSTHTTFNTAKNIPYMEGHHLIPCTVKNSQMIKNKYGSRLDREENIVCLCPNCHRKIHFGDSATKEAIITNLYNKQNGKLKMVGINITLDELKDLYK